MEMKIHLIPTDKPSRLTKQGDDLEKIWLYTRPIDFRANEIYPQHIYITDNSEIKEVDWIFANQGTHKVTDIKDDKYPYGTLNYKGDKIYHHKSWKKIILTTDPDLIKEGIQPISDEFLQWFVKNPSCEEVEVIKNYLSNNGQWKDVLLPSEWEIDTKIKYKIIIPHEEPKNTCPKCRTKDFDTCHSIKCPMRKEKTINPNNQEVMFHKEHKEYFHEDFIDGKHVTVWLGKNYVPKKEPKQETIKKAAKSYRSSTANKMAIEKVAFIEGAKSNAAKDHWFKIFKEQDKNKFSDEEVLEFANWCRIQDNKHPNRVITTQQLFEQFKNQEDGND
jgi:hypothetical protein